MSAAEADKELAEVRSAVELTDDQKARLATALGQATGKAVELKVDHRPDRARRPRGPDRRHRDRRLREDPPRAAEDRVLTLRPDATPTAKEETTQMAELTINTADIAAALKKNLEGFAPGLEAAQVGRVIEVGDGIATVSGLPGVGVNELLEFEGGIRGLALNLDEDSIGAVVLGDGGAVREGSTVKATGQILSVPAGDGVLGRVVDALGNPVDGKGPLTNVHDRRMEIQAPGIIGRKPVHEPLQTGIKAIDAMTPIGRGQRELIIGDRKTGKTTIAIDTIINQRGLGVKCVYVAIGLKESTVANTVATLEAARRHGVHGGRRGRCLRPRPVQVPRPLRRLRHGPALDGERRARPDRLRRPVQAGRGLPPGVAAAPPPAGPRGLPGRRVLPAQPPPRAGRQAVRRQRRRLAHRPPGHRDQGRRHLGLHPHQRDLDHRRPGLPPGRPVQVRCAARVRHRPVGVPRGWRRPDQGHEDRRGHAEGRPVPVPRARGVRLARLRARQGSASRPSTAATASSSC